MKIAASFIVVALTLFVFAPIAHAEDGCDKFAWPLTRERTLFATTDKTKVKSGDTLAALPTAGFAGAD